MGLLNPTEGQSSEPALNSLRDAPCGVSTSTSRGQVSSGRPGASPPCTPAPERALCPLAFGKALMVTDPWRTSDLRSRASRLCGPHPAGGWGGGGVEPPTCPGPPRNRARSVLCQAPKPVLLLLGPKKKRHLRSEKSVLLFGLRVPPNGGHVSSHQALLHLGAAKPSLRFLQEH